MDEEYIINWVPKKSINIENINNLLCQNIKSNRFTNNGPNTVVLENIIRKQFEIDNTKSIILVSNGTVALNILTSAIEYDLNKKLQWATQSFTFPSSAQGSLSNVKIIDVDNDGGLDLEEVDNTIDGIIVTNIFGSIVDINKYIIFGEKYNKYIIFDNAATMYTFYNGKNCLNYGVGCTISLHHTKPFGFGEGGAIIVDNKYEHIIRSLINFGFNICNKYYLPEGTNAKISDISSIYIIQYLNDNFTKIIKKHTELYIYIKNLLETTYKKLNCKLFPSYHTNIITMACFPLIFENYNDNIRLNLLKNKFFCKKYYHPLLNTPNATKLYNNILCIPCSIDMDTQNIDDILNIIYSSIY